MIKKTGLIGVMLLFALLANAQKEQTIVVNADQDQIGNSTHHVGHFL